MKIITQPFKRLFFCIQNSKARDNTVSNSVNISLFTFFIFMTFEIPFNLISNLAMASNVRS